MGIIPPLPGSPNPDNTELPPPGEQPIPAHDPGRLPPGTPDPDVPLPQKDPEPPQPQRL
jgi:hypothetical protein